MHTFDLGLYHPLDCYHESISVGKEGCPENSKDVAKPSQMPKAKTKGKKVLSGMSVLQRMQAKLSEESASSVSSGELSDSVEEANDSLTPMLLENLSDPDSVPACEENLPVGQRIERNKESTDSKHDVSWASILYMLMKCKKLLNNMTIFYFS